jgi:hypothetical protein
MDGQDDHLGYHGDLDHLDHLECLASGIGGKVIKVIKVINILMVGGLITLPTFTAGLALNRTL